MPALPFPLVTPLYERQESPLEPWYKIYRFQFGKKSLRVAAMVAQQS
jgi:hypothetical protein